MLSFSSVLDSRAHRWCSELTMSSNELSTVILDEFCLADEELLAVLERCEEECVITHERRCGRELVDNL